MKVVHLPRGIVRFLNSLQPGVSDPEALEAFWADREGAARWLEEESGYAMDDEEVKTLENIGLLWEQVDAALEEAQGEALRGRLLPLLYEAALLMEKVTSQRDRGNFSPQPAVNRLMIAGAAYCQGRANRQALARRLEILEEFSGNLRRMHRRMRLEVPREFRQDIDGGLRHLEEGVAGLKAGLGADETKAIEESLSQVHAGASLVQYLLDWDRKEMDLLAQRFQRFNIPVIGPQLESELEASRTAPRGRWSGPAKVTLEISLPRLEAFWERILPGLLVPPEARDQLVAGVDEGIAQLYAAYEQIFDEEVSDQEATEGLEQAMLAASAAFTSIEQAAISADGFRETLSGAYIEAAQGILIGSVPDATLQSMLRGDPPLGGPPVAAAFQAYLRSGSPQELCRAVLLMVESVPRQEAPASELLCTFCGQASPVEASLCIGCGARLGFSGRAWQG